MLLTIILSCGRKDIQRNGDIRLRGEDKVSLHHKKEGDFLQKGLASWYGKKYHGRKTSNGETYNMYAMTAAHKTLPFNTLIRVVNTENGRETLVRINDRGPFVRGRIIDLSKAAAADIGLDISGVAKVRLYLANSVEKNRKTLRKRNKSSESGIIEQRWTIQIGSFSGFLRARNLVARFEGCGHRVRIEKFKNMFRVRIGSFKTREKAEGAMQTLDLTGLDSWVLKD
jgi:rare lipoprotein A